MTVTIEQARERVAKVAEIHGEHDFAREVRTGVWDNRNDVKAILAGGILRGEQRVVMVACNNRGSTLVMQSPAKDYVPIREDRILTPSGPETIVNADILGDCLFELVNKAWKAGYDPTTIRFKVMFE